MSELTEVEEVRRANQAFYRAFESLAIERMDHVWAHDGQVTCVHPGWPLAVGWAEVRATWVTILHNTAEIHFEVADEQIEVRGDLAWVVCVEKLSSRAGGGGGSGEVLATNVFRREDGRWRLVHHHGSPHVPRPAAAPLRSTRRTLN
ncbi:MAG: DUF4440 domain-containing protein [Myxococcales bacterium]|nr:DUF4440 domain-containing protein [Myxococcales bacterium]